MIRIGLSSWAFGWAVRHGRPRMNELDLVELARRNRLDVVQIGDNLPAHLMGRARRARLAGALASAGLDLELGARGLTRAQLLTYLTLCREFGSRLLRFVVDDPPYLPTPHTVSRLLRAMAPRLQDAGVTLAIENHDRFPATLLRDMVMDADSPFVAVCLDTCNSLGAGEGLAEVTRVLAPLTVNLHVKDVMIRRVPSKQGFAVDGCTLGDGLLPIQRTIEIVRATGRCRSVILEAWTPPQRTMAGTVALEAANAAVSLERLRRSHSGAVTRPRGA